MPDERPTTLAGRIRRKRRLVAWAVFLLVCGLLSAAHALLDRRHLQAAAAERDVQARFAELWSEINRFYLRPRGALEAGLNGGRPLVGRTISERADHHWPPVFMDPGIVGNPPAATTAPATAPVWATSFRATLPGSAVGPRYAGWTITLHFVNDQLRGAVSSAPKRVVYREPPPAWIVAQVIRRAALFVAALVWAGCLLTLLLSWSWRRQIAQVALACVMIMAAGWFLGPLTDWVPARLLHRMPAVLGILGGLTFLFTLPFPRRRRRETHPTCAGCRYDLTGNESGICPECGRVTPQGLVDRWREEAELIEAVEEAPTEEMDPMTEMSEEDVEAIFSATDAGGDDAPVEITGDSDLFFHAPSPRSPPLHTPGPLIPA